MLTYAWEFVKLATKILPELSQATSCALRVLAVDHKRLPFELYFCSWPSVTYALPDASTANPRVVKLTAPVRSAHKRFPLGPSFREKAG